MDQYDEGLARNVRRLFGTGDDYEGMDKPLSSVSVNDDRTRLTFAFQDGTAAMFDAEGDCCSNSWIEHLTVPDDVAGAVITAVLDGRMSQSDADEDRLLQVYNTHFRTAKGDIIVEYRNESNGYYGGYLTRVR